MKYLNYQAEQMTNKQIVSDEWLMATGFALFPLKLTSGFFKNSVT